VLGTDQHELTLSCDHLTIWTPCRPWKGAADGTGCSTAISADPLPHLLVKVTLKGLQAGNLAIGPTFIHGKATAQGKVRADYNTR
jgi:hypothetical protein